MKQRKLPPLPRKSLNYDWLQQALLRGQYQVEGEYMSALEIGAVIFGLVFLLIFIGVPIWASLALGGIICAFAFLPQIGVARHAPWTVLNSFILIAIPLFVFMGQIMLRSGMGTILYDGSAALLKWAPGGLLHANIASCAIFAAISGSSVATAATIGTVAIPELETRGYDRKIVYGSLAAGGTLGILIPPSIAMIIYGAVVGESVGRLFIAGIFPGIMLALLFMVYIAVRTIIQPDLAPAIVEKLPLKETVLRVSKMWPVLVIMTTVLGGIYLGVMTPTECAAVGAVLALVFSLIYRSLTWSMLKKCLLNSVKTTTFIMFIVIGALILSSVLALLHVPGEIVVLVTGLPIPPLAIIVAIYGIYLFLGCFMDGISMMVLTLPFVFPVIVALGYSPIWFGVVVVTLIEVGLLTPPVGINLYVIHGLVPHIPVGEVIRGSMPFFLMMLVGLAIMTAFPEIATWLPSTMRAVGG